MHLKWFGKRLVTSPKLETTSWNSKVRVQTPKFKLRGASSNRRVTNLSLRVISSRGSFIKYVRKIFQETNISYSLMRTRTCAYQEVRNASFSENIAYVLNDGSQILGSSPQVTSLKSDSHPRKNVILFVSMKCILKS